MYRKLAVLLLTGAALLSIAFLTGTAALYIPTLDRTPTVLLSTDPGAAIGLSGWADDTYAIAETFTHTGTLDSRFGQSLASAVSMVPQVTLACRTINKQGSCNQGQWTLTYCLTTSLAAAGTTTCTAGSTLEYQGTGPGSPAPQSLGLSLVPSQTYYVLTRVEMQNSTPNSVLCGTTMLSVAGSGADGVTVNVGHSEQLPRRQYVTWGSGC